MTYKVSDNAATTLASGISNSPAVTSLILTDATNFPVINHGGSGTEYTYVTLYDAANNIENVKVTRRDSGSNTLTIVRGTAAGITGVSDASCLAWAGTTTGVACRLIAHFVNEMLAITAADHVADATAAHAASAVSFTPSGTISATDVQAAIAELDSETQTALGGKAASGHNHAGVYEPADATILKSAAIGATVQGYDVDTAFIDQSQTWTGAPKTSVQADNDLSFDISTKKDFTCTPTAGGTLTFTGIAAGQKGEILLVNNSNYAISKIAAVKCSSSMLTTISATGTYLLAYRCFDGTNVHVTNSGALL